MRLVTVNVTITPPMGEDQHIQVKREWPPELAAPEVGDLLDMTENGQVFVLELTKMTYHLPEGGAELHYDAKVVDTYPEGGRVEPETKPAPERERGGRRDEPARGEAPKVDNSLPVPGPNRPDERPEAEPRR